MPMKIRNVLLGLAVLACFLLALNRLEAGQQDQGKQQLEEALRRTAVACFASEGAYPPSVRYMQERYGLQYDRDRYTVRYELFATNLMPDITVLEVGP